MKVGVVGPGAIGLLFSFYLQRCGVEVTLYTKDEKQATALRKSGVTCIYNGKRETVFLNVLPIESIVDRDELYIFIAVKQYHLQSVLPWIGEEKHLIFLQNGIGHLQYLKSMKMESVAVGIVEHGAKKECAGVVEHTGSGVTKFGVVTGDPSMFEFLLYSFDAEKFPIMLEKDWHRTMIKKLVVNACINPLTALLKVSNGELVTNSSYNVMMKQVFDEVTYVLGERHKEELWKFVCAVCEQTARNTSSMLADVEHNRRTEIDAIVGYIIEQAEEQRKKVPTLMMLYHFIKALEM
ncbi:2-dehydropantoate 2-reductase [Bacillus manliponensis]|uniref:2-dehydropantoate 2-reductase n=1 Tax=Bacillus manliponensis TaxID=574376 RepID=UPI00351295E0